MSDIVNIHQVGVQINFRAWERFDLERLGVDGVVLFQYLVFHCQNNPEWTHSDNGLQLELGIKRSRLTVLRTETFADFLTTRVVKDRNGNDIRAYQIDFARLATLPVLTQLYRSADANGEPYDLSEYVAVFKSIASKQPSTKTAKTKVDQAKRAQVNQLAQRMKDTFDSRRKEHNVKQSREGKRTAAGTINFSPDSLRKLQNALTSVGDKEFIYQAFIVFCDALNYSSSDLKHGDFDQLLPETPKSPLRYFLSYTRTPDEELASFRVIQSFGDYYASHYGRG